MTLPLGATKGRIALVKHQANLEQIAEDYFDREKYEVLYDGIIVEEGMRYRYGVKKVLEKWDISSYAELSFLIMTLKGESKGLCKFCGKEYFEWPMRDRTVSSHCGCVGNCSICKSPFSDRYGIFKGVGCTPLCNQCRWREQETTPKVPPTKDEIEQNWLNHIESPLFFSSNAELMELDSEHIDFIIKVLSQKLRLFKKIKEIQAED